MTEKPFAESCERNRLPILKVIKPLLNNANSLLEIGSGTGQHGVYFAQELSDLSWQTSDLIENHDAINRWVTDSQLKNLLPPLRLNVLSDSWPENRYDAIYSANTAHIMSWEAVKAMIAGVSKCLNKGGHFILYGPFNYAGEFTSESNRRFEQWLKSQGDERGIRDFEKMQELADKHQLSLFKDYSMPANNRILVWNKC